MSDMLCVLAEYDAETERALAQKQSALLSKGFSGTQTMGIPQHITLGTFGTDAEARLCADVAVAARDSAPFPVTFSHIGVFGGGRVLFIAPDASEKLLALKARFGDAAGFAPHSTMLMDTPEAVYRALPLLAEDFAAFSGTVQALSLYAFFPARRIMRKELSGREYPIVLEPLSGAFTICKLAHKAPPDARDMFRFTALTDNEDSLVCQTERVPADATARSDGWRALRVAGTLDFALTGILARVAAALAKGGIPVFAVSSYDTDYLLVKDEHAQSALSLLGKSGCRVAR